MVGVPGDDLLHGYAFPALFLAGVLFPLQLGLDAGTDYTRS
jgi:hypothetical protein